MVPIRSYLAKQETRAGITQSKALGNREARRELTQQILRAFEPQIREDIDQWYQFVPIWPNQALEEE